MFFSADVAPSLDRHEGLSQILSDQLKRPILPSLTDYLAMPAKDREALDVERLTYLGRELTIATPQVRKLLNQVRLAMINNRDKVSGRGGVMVSGESTVGKTTACLALMRSVHSLYGRQYAGFEQRNEIPVAYVEVPAGSSAKAMVGRFATFYGLEVPGRPSLEEILTAVVTVMRSCKTQLVVVDELQNLSRISSGNGESVDVLKSLSNQVPATFVYSGINIHQGGLLVGDRGNQIGRRFTLLQMSRYGRATQDDKKIWNGIVMAFSTELPLLAQDEKELLREAAWLHKRSGGNIGTLQRLLVGGSQLLILDGDPTCESLTREKMEDIPLDLAADDRPCLFTSTAPAWRNLET